MPLKNIFFYVISNKMQAVRSSVARMGGMGVRRMAGGHGHGTPVQYTGIEASVRKMLPENYQVRYLR